MTLSASDCLIAVAFTATALLGSEFYLNSAFEQQNPVPALDASRLSLGPHASIDNLRFTRLRTSLFFPSYRRQVLRLEGTVVNGGDPTIGRFDLICRFQGVGAPFDQALFETRIPVAAGTRLDLKLSQVARQIDVAHQVQGARAAHCQLGQLHHHDTSADQRAPEPSPTSDG